jgi:hypothetical protein
MDADYFSMTGDYLPLLQSFGPIIIKVDDDDYQGDSRVLYKGYDDKFGVLVFGFGSCSGCDALQACDSYDDLEQLRLQLESSIKWGIVSETLEYLIGHDWDVDATYGRETAAFVSAATAYLKALI